MDSKTRSRGQQNGAEKMKSISWIQMSSVAAWPTVDIGGACSHPSLSHCFLSAHCEVWRAGPVPRAFPWGKEEQN